MNALLIVAAGLITVIVGIVFLRLHAFLALTLAAIITAILTSQNQIEAFALQSGYDATKAGKLATQGIGGRLADAFGGTVAKVGLLIAFASITGMALLKSGGAERIVRALLRIFGIKNTDLALLTASFTLAIPVFFDTVFYLLIPIVKSTSIRKTSQFSLLLMCSIAGGVMTHSLVPPTPGPLFVAKELHVDIGLMILMGIIVGGISVFFGYLYALWANKKWDLPLRDTPDISIAEIKQQSTNSAANLPSLFWSTIPILLPLILITGNTLLNLSEIDAESKFKRFFEVMGESTVALFCSAVMAMLVLWFKNKDRVIFEKNLSDALASAAMIILITGAGGAFGQMLQQTNIGSDIGQWATHYRFAILPMAFLITALVRSAQGSATVAMVTAIGVMNGIGDFQSFGIHPVYLALAIGCGSKIFAWMNDSAYWIISNMSGMNTRESMRFFSFLLLVMGLAGLAATMVLSYFFPLV